MIVAVMSLINHLISINIVEYKKQTRFNLLIDKLLKVAKIFLLIVIVFIGYLFAWFTGDKP